MNKCAKFHGDSPKGKKVKCRLFIIISRASKWRTLKSAGNRRCAVHAETHSICTARPRPGPAAGVRVSPTSDTCQSVAILMNRRPPISRARLNFRRRPILCTTLYRNPMQASNFGGAFDQLLLHLFVEFSQKMPLYFFYTMVQTSQKWPKTQIKGGGGVLP